MSHFNAEFEGIVEANPDISVLGGFAPDGFFELVGADGSRACVSRIVFMEHTNAIFDALKDPGADIAEVVSPVAGLEPLVRRVVLSSAWDYFMTWYRDSCPVEALPFAVFHMVAFTILYRELCAGAPEFSGEFFPKSGVDHV
ncbi:hypothetical protein ACR5KS_02950 [Leucobacter sp. W1153]|uniref:hypothetical protein n=1 Tax=Leucobacter sp. W1153 TaxID=3439064 RepID=UPI003F3860E6